MQCHRLGSTSRQMGIEALVLEGAQVALEWYRQLDSLPGSNPWMRDVRQRTDEDVDLPFIIRMMTIYSSSQFTSPSPSRSGSSRQTFSRGADAPLRIRGKQKDLEVAMLL